MQKAKTRGILYDLPYGYPAMIVGDGCVCGEILELDDAEKALAILDELEDYHGPGEDNEYDRRQIAVTAEDGSVHACYVYVYPEDRREWLEQHGIRVDGGDWGHARARKGKKRSKTV
jgi:gamma-glutamylcyclotransferase (GGCT)/AIG2-like uncharacterized protein YtfP